MLHPLHLFEEGGVPYAADIEKARIVELSAVMVDILKLAETQDGCRDCPNAENGLCGRRHR